ncbi:glycoside hydrolase 5 family protein [Kineosporia babensis]|uniref:Cellulase (Glycosyl hydrolase family 5) n=1 Tax=Kineosporia babensis TaxID=499548 RepID=A0A9X1ST12_9ACTN|nr:hypothetical protein [Kineosporia babensis]MCD5311289.1 hypothetical protein [Kineosporia babensis]
MTRNVLGVLAALVALVTAALTLISTSSSPEDASVLPDQSFGFPLGSDTFGIAAGSSLPSLTEPELDQQLSGMAELGATWVRFDLDWSQIGAAGPGQYDWGVPDRLVAAVTAKGLQPLAILDYTPEWARAEGCTNGPACAPREAADFATFAAAATARYSGMGLRTWEIWNEPNLSQFYAPRPDPAGYTALLQAAYASIKAVDPGAMVITGGTAPAGTAQDGSTLTAKEFLAQVYLAGGQGSFDAVAHHPYTFPYSPATAYSGGAWSDLSALHTIMSSYGDGKKRIWATEYGAPTGGPADMAQKDVRRPYDGVSHVSEPLQATIAGNAIRRYQRIAWAGPMFWYSYQDSGSDASSIENFFGLVRTDGTRKPAYDAVRDAISPASEDK